MARAALPRPAGLPRPHGRQVGAGYDPVGAIAAIFAGTEANPADFSKLTRLNGRRSSAPGARSAGKDALAGSGAHINNLCAVAIEHQSARAVVERSDIGIQTDFLERTQVSSRTLDGDSLEATEVFQHAASHGEQHSAATGHAPVTLSAADVENQRVIECGPIRVCSADVVSAHDTSVQTDKEQTSVIGCQTFTAVTIDACEQAGPVTSVSEVQTEDTIELMESASKPTCSSTAEVQTESCASGPHSACADTEMQTDSVLAPGVVDVEVQCEAQVGHCSHCHAQQSQSELECVLLRQQLEEERQLRQQQAVQFSKREEALNLEVATAAAEGCAEERQENEHLNTLLRDERSKSEMFEAMLKKAKEQIGAQESALQSLEQLDARYSQEQANGIRQKRVLDDSKKMIERQVREIEELRSTLKDGSRVELEKMLQHALEETASLREIVRRSTLNDGSREEAEKKLQHAHEEIASLREIVRDFQAGAEGRSADRRWPDSSPERVPERSSSQPASTAALRRGEDDSFTGLPTRSRTSSLPPVNGTLRPSIHATAQGRGPRNIGAVGSSSLPPLPGPRTLKSTKITTLADVGRG